MDEIKLSDIANGGVIPYSVQEKLEKEEQNNKMQKKQHLQYLLHDLLITIISVLLSNADRIYTFISNLLNNLLGD